MTFVNQWTDNNFLCLPASIFVFITLIVSTQARHLNTWWGQILVNTLLVWLSAPGIFYSWESCVFLYCLQSAIETFLSILRTFSCLHDYRNGPLVSVRFEMNYFIYKIKGNIGTVSHRTVQHFIQNWPRALLCFRCSVLWLKIVCLLCIVRYCTFPSAVWRHF